ncbi:casein kinase-like protein I isoform epsilon [Eremomyces bilateralis CBS 781.70]|uniref:non-specific serine/threonine protein kinase n=1 Tax=Eremomyces bilateralis CBS 781.70 TaxID=1392243 RepID=A0A6G1FUU7_9PEZI|nr:casein kinase-like protein I isoform epsilon [Eremomyces bilateralis CBS 781.70]KAF1809587.1 casein kinase-like protein I isoform epsilon [Eremomyces bilateralis CBS 781.70]
MKPIVVRNKYQLDLRLGGGSYGEVYQCHNIQTGQEVALKLEYNQISPSHLENEVEIYNELAGVPGIPQVYWHGYECEFRVMAFELLGPNLENLFNYCSRRFSLKTVLMLADQLIPRFQCIHSKGYIHRDVKPDNLLMGDGKQGNTVYMTDIGLAKEIEGGDRQSYPVVGTLRYASINAHLGKEQSPHDDIESLGYVFLYFLRGSLPWQSLKAKSPEKETMILERKQHVQEDDLFDGVPEEFKKYFEHVRSGEKLDYSYLLRLFRNLFRRKGFEYDYVFDWTILKFLEEPEGKQKSS